MSYWDSSPFQQILKIKSNLKVNLCSFNTVWLVKKTRPTISSFYYKLIKYLCQITLLKADTTQKDLLSQSKNSRRKVQMKRKKRINSSSKRMPNTSFSCVSSEHIHHNPTKLFLSNQQDVLYTEYVFLRIYWDMEKMKAKEGKYDYWKWNYHGYLK